MPLLKKRSFEKVSTPEFLRDEEEVFYCEVTNEIFRNYEEFAERMLLCTSMVWTCSMTGKSNLTYVEALESEENAKRSIKEFPVELRIPVLYVGSKTKKSGFGEMAEEVFFYCKDRYFIGEKLETSFTANKWIESHVLQVIPPTPEEIMKASPRNGNTEKHSNPPASLYKYEIEHLDADDKDISEIMIVDHNNIRRKKTIFNREKCKLFLKQYVEQDSKGGRWIIKPSVVKAFGLDTIKFDRIFSGPEPNFDLSKKLERMSDPKRKSVVNGKKSRQETLAKYLTKMNGSVKNNGASETSSPKTPKNTPNTKKNSELLEQMEKRKEEFAKQKQIKEEERLELQKQQKKDYLWITSQLREWYRPDKEDLQLEDQKPLPILPPIKSKIPDEHVGDVLMLMEFIKSFDKFLTSKNFFPSGVTFETMERALTEEELAGPLIDLIQMLLTALFREQEEENSEYTMMLAKTKAMIEKIDINNMTLDEASKLATQAAKWSSEKQGLSLRNLPLYSLTVSEVLRLHLLASGAVLQENGERGRFANRGGYSATDDPGLYLRLHKPHILKALRIKNVVQLRVKDKIEILTCLMYQLLTYADIRDAIEDRIEKTRQDKIELRSAIAAEKKRENEYNTAKWHLKREAKLNHKDPKETAKALEDLKETEEKRKMDSEKQMETCFKTAYENETYLGTDRAYRRYYKLDSVPGVFVDGNEDNVGLCLLNPVKQIPKLVNADKSVVTKHIRSCSNKLNSSDKENTPSKRSPEKLDKLNGEAAIEEEQPPDNLTMCNGDENTCKVHSKMRKKDWTFMPHEETIDSFVSSLNKRGLRESELLQTMKNDKDTLAKTIKQTPVHHINGDLDIIQDEEKPRVATRSKKNYMDPNFGFPPGTSIESILQNTLTDDILELEEKIYSGSLGQIQTRNRDLWRSTLASKDYKNFNREIIRRVYEDSDVKNEIKEEDEAPLEGRKRLSTQDPGSLLGKPKLGSDGEADEGDVEEQPEETKLAIECLAIALAQVAQAVEPKFLLKPLGNSTKRALAANPTRNRLDAWESSLLGSKSFSQISLHYSTLDSCIMWNRSTLLARCKICRRQKDSENMLLCDSCNSGHHLYCLKPKLRSIPKGDWFCDRCAADKDRQNRTSRGEIIPKKKRRLFKEEQEEEEEPVAKEEAVDVDDEEEGEEEESEDNAEEDDENDETFNGEGESAVLKVELCGACNSGGTLITCEDCETSYHKECVDPPVRRVKPGWLCNNCKGTYNKGDKEESKSENSRRNGRSRRSEAIKTEDDDDMEAEETHNSQRKRSIRRESGRDDLPLHNAALQDLLTEVMKHQDAWPFLRPVQKNEVPDYHEVITSPMDFGTIKYKLNMGEYNTDSQLMYDAALVFQNCSTYNEANSEIYKCGERLLEFYRSKCSELGLKSPYKNQHDDESKKRRTK